MDYEEIVDYNYSLQEAEKEVAAAKKANTILDKRLVSIKKLINRLNKLGVNTTNLSNSLTEFKVERNVNNINYKACLNDLYEKVGYDTYKRAVEASTSMMNLAHGVSLNKCKAGIGTLARGETSEDAKKVYAMSLADFKQKLKKRLKLLKKIRAKLSPIRYATAKHANEWLALRLEVHYLRKARNKALRALLKNPSFVLPPAVDFSMKISYVIHNAISIEQKHSDRKFFYENRPYAEKSDNDVRPFLNGVKLTKLRKSYFLSDDNYSQSCVVKRV